jgi:hypothetical protein
MMAGCKDNKACMGLEAEQENLTEKYGGPVNFAEKYGNPELPAEGYGTPGLNRNTDEMDKIRLMASLCNTRTRADIVCRVQADKKKEKGKEKEKERISLIIPFIRQLAAPCCMVGLKVGPKVYYQVSLLDSGASESLMTSSMCKRLGIEDKMQVYEGNIYKQADGRQLQMIGSIKCTLYLGSLAIEDIIHAIGAIGDRCNRR